MKKFCYACGKVATTTEHVPPLSIFPEEKDVPSSQSYRNELITVPSCDDHNLKKSKDDEYLMMILVAHFANNEVANQQLRSKVVRAWQRRPHLARMAVMDAMPARLNGEETITFRVDMERFTRSMELIAKGLIFHGTGMRWPRPFQIWGTNMLPSNFELAEKVLATSNQVKDAMAHVFQNAPILGANPDVFHYQMYAPTPPAEVACVRLVFYGGLEIAALSGPQA